jgi:hypothetical protein
VRHLISTGYLSLESRETPAAVAIALEAWIYDNVTWATPDGDLLGSRVKIGLARLDERLFGFRKADPKFIRGAP